MSQPSDDPLKYSKNNSTYAEFILHPVSVGFATDAIMTMDNSKSPGPDRLPVKVLKDAVNIVSEPLTLIYNTSLERGIFFPELEISQNNINF